MTALSDEQVAWLAAAVVYAGQGLTLEDSGPIEALAKEFYAALTDHWLKEEER